MKNSIKIAALFVLLSITFFSTVSAKTIRQGSPSKNGIAIYSLPSEIGVEVKVHKSAPGKVVVIIYDEYDNVFYKQVLPVDSNMDKYYNLMKLDNGNYTIAVTTNKQVMRKDFQVYDHICHIL